MRFRRVLLVTTPGAPAHAAMATLRGVSPDCELLWIVLLSPRPSPWAWLQAEKAFVDTTDEKLAELRLAAAAAAQEVRIELVEGVGADDLDERVASAEVELVVLAPAAQPVAAAVAEVRRRRPLHVLWTAAEGSWLRPAQRSLPLQPSQPSQAPRELLCDALTPQARQALGSFLRDYATPEIHCRLLVTASRPPVDLAATLAAEGIRVSAELAGGAQVVRDLWREEGSQQRADLVVLARWPGRLPAFAAPRLPFLVLPRAQAPAGQRERAIDLPDLLVVDGFARARLRYAHGVGRREPMRDQPVEVVAGGGVIAALRTEGGVLELADALCGEGLGVRRSGGSKEGSNERTSKGTDEDRSIATEIHVRVIRPGPRPLVLVDESLPGGDLATLAAHSATVDVLPVRLRPLRSCRAIRARWLAAGLPPLVADAAAVLDEGDALDISAAADAVRLARVASRLRANGYPVAAIVCTGPHRPYTAGFAVLRPTELAEMAELAAAASDSGGVTDPPPPPSRSIGDRLAAVGGSAATAGNRVEVELDNATARRWLLDALAAAHERVHFQVYIALDDDIGTTVEAALAATAARGVLVRVLVDSFHGLHGSLGAHNPLLDRLASRPGVELRVSRPVTTLPSLEDLKQRNHRKLLIADGAVALVGGRNLSHEYYTGFAEVALTARSLWREVPWLDAGARIEGPAVARLDEIFRDSWQEAGGEPFPISVRPPAGSSPVRVISHDGLRDAATLEAFLALVDAAQSHVYVINGFPLLLEIQHALLRALRRGVRVRTLFGNLTPTHAGIPFGGPWSSARMAATELVHSRQDLLVQHGAEAYRLAVPEQPGWEPGLGSVRPHVHAKALSADGVACAVGSANLDITASYWESEVLLVVEDATVARAFEARVDQLIAGSERVDSDDPEWQATALRRQWMRRWPGVLSV